MGLELAGNEITYLSINGGKFKQSVDEGTEGAVHRDWEVDGKKGTKWEIAYKWVKGHITKLYFKDGKFGEQFNIILTDGGEDYMVSVKATSNFGTDFYAALPNIDLTKEVHLSPSDKNGKKKLWISQDGENVQNHYETWDEEKKQFIIKNGMPANKPKKAGNKDIPKTKWQIYFLGVFDFLRTEVEKRIEAFEKEPAVKVESEPQESMTENQPDDLPF